MEIGSLTVEQALVDFVAEELAPLSGVSADDFWAGLESLCRDLGPKHQTMLDTRDELQELIDAWHRDHRGAAHDTVAYADHLREIGYLSYYGDEVEVSTSHVDEEITSIAGPQLVVPLDNSRYALNAANARWGSFYDALYGTDVISRGRWWRGARDRLQPGAGGQGHRPRPRLSRPTTSAADVQASHAWSTPLLHTRSSISARRRVATVAR